MAIPTETKKRTILEYINSHQQEWKSMHPNNIYGFRVDKKSVGGILKKNYSIVFQVASKITEDHLEEQQIIPKSFHIEFPDGKTRVVKTDIEETGVFRFQSLIASRATSVYSQNYGTLALLVYDDHDRVFGLSNYHVIAEQQMNRGIYTYKRPPTQIQNDVTFTNIYGHTVKGRFEEGLISEHNDIAFVQLNMSPNQVTNIFPDGRRARGKYLPPNNIMPSSIIQRAVVVYSVHNRMGIQGRISNNAVTIYSSNIKQNLKNLIQIRPRITNGGDSGSAVVLYTNDSVIGIIIGADDMYSYAIPFYEVNNFRAVAIP